MSFNQRAGHLLVGILLSLVSGLATAQEYAIEEIVVTAGRSDGAPVVFSIKADYHLQPIRIINDSLVAEERSRDVKKTYEEIVTKALKDPKITLVNSTSNLRSVSSASDFSQRYQNDKGNNKSYVFLVLKSEVKQHNPEDGSYLSSYKNFLRQVEGAGRTKLQIYGDSDVTIINPRQYRTNLIQSIGRDMQHITKSLGGDYRAIISGLDSELDWHREGEDNVEFYIPYQFMIIPTNIASIPPNY